MVVVDRPSGDVQLGLRENMGQFALLVGVAALIGGVVGQERAIVPLLAEEEFGVGAITTTLSFIAAFGAVKAITNLWAGALADRFGRKPVLLAGWLVGIPVPLIVIWAPSWSWVVVANLLLGLNQGLTWSTAVIMKIDLVGPERRGMALGFNEASGYAAVAVTALATSAIANEWGLRPGPFLLGLALAGLGLGLSTFFVRETQAHVEREAASSPPGASDLTSREVFALSTYREASLSAASQAGLVNNLNDGLAWGVFPVLFAAHGLSVVRIGILAALYPAVWGIGQVFTGALSDRIGRKPLIVAGMFVQAIALGLFAAASGFQSWAVAAVVLGAGTAMVYPTLMAVVGDVAHPSWRARAVGVYRLWRDLGLVAGVLVAGVLADAVSLDAAIYAVAGITAASGVVVLIRMSETNPRPGTRGKS